MIEFRRMKMEWLYVLGAYLLGSVSFASLVARMAGQVELRSVGSGNLGATNVARSVGVGWGLMVFVMDLLKGLIPVALTQAQGIDVMLLPWLPLSVAAGAAALLGHCFPVWHGFRGGKGVATTSGILIGVSPALFGIVLLVFLAGLAATRMVSVGSMLAAVALPIAYISLLRREAMQMPQMGWLALFFLMTLLILLLHRGNILRIIEGTEPKLGNRRNEA